MNNNIYRESFFNGLGSFRNGDLVKAREYFNVSVKSKEFREQSLHRLISIDFKEGKYRNARELLNEYYDDNAYIMQSFGLLESIENNFETSMNYYCKCMNDTKIQKRSLLAIAKLYVQNADYAVAKKIFETLKLDEKMYFQAVVGLISISILEHDYEKSKNLLEKIDTSSLTPKLMQHYKTLLSYTEYLLGTLKPKDNIDPIHDYMIYRLFNNSDKVLINHIMKHLDQTQKYSNGCFFKGAWLQDLLSISRDKIESMNANHFEVSDMYRFSLDTPIGYKGDDMTKDICVVTMIGTKDIVTMYPVQLSYEFDKERFSTSKKIMLKRQGENKK